ncbi:hypothetical protein Cantr_02647 [Candida viswanathii]|uniref:Uncharacterized protein n=1 Tax=Candida viswanathii TaxID=5486 RepID=A0A367YN16_9ASCO|nr:hypothetical protein Cantr_02647 [Candida viswanathii]
MAKPLPLIDYQSPPKDTLDYLRLLYYGYLLLTATWLLFIVTVNSIFEIWKYVVQPVPAPLRDTLTMWFETIDAYVIKLWCIYVVCWWWAIVSWCGLEMFRNSKR